MRKMVALLIVTMTLSLFAPTTASASRPGFSLWGWLMALQAKQDKYEEARRELGLSRQRSSKGTVTASWWSAQYLDITRGVKKGNLGGFVAGNVGAPKNTVASGTR